MFQDFMKFSLNHMKMIYIFVPRRARTDDLHTASFGQEYKRKNFCCVIIKPPSAPAVSNRYTAIGIMFVYI